MIILQNVLQKRSHSFSPPEGFCFSFLESNVWYLFCDAYRGFQYSFLGHVLLKDTGLETLAPLRLVFCVYSAFELTDKCGCCHSWIDQKWQFNILPSSCLSHSPSYTRILNPEPGPLLLSNSLPMSCSVVIRVLQWRSDIIMKGLEEETYLLTSDKDTVKAGSCSVPHNAWGCRAYCRTLINE